MNRRSLRLKLVAGLGTVIGLSLFSAGLNAQSTTSTAIGAQTGASGTQSNPSGTCSLTTVTTTVSSSQGIPTGTVALSDTASGSAVSLGSQTLNASGQAVFTLALDNGSHTLVANYAGDTTHTKSTSPSTSVTVSSQCTASFVVNISSLSATSVTAGQAITANITVTPLSGFLTSLGNAPGFITVSCSGLPNQATCTFSPSDLEILPTQHEAVSSSMVLQTQAAGTTRLRALPSPNGGKGSGPVAWAFLLPGMIGLGGLAWGARRRRWLNHLALVALVGFVATLGTTACNPQYYYYNHGPPTTLATPAGTYNVTVTAQYSNGITAITQNTVFALTVK